MNEFVWKKVLKKNAYPGALFVIIYNQYKAIINKAPDTKKVHG